METATKVDAANVRGLVGQTFHSPWVRLDQKLVDEFAELTGDHHWIHVDREKAKRELGGTIVHGFLTLALFAYLGRCALNVVNFHNAYNYGFDKVRFTGLVRVDSNVRLTMKIVSVTGRPDGSILVYRHCEIEVMGSARPAIVARWIAIFYVNATEGLHEG